MTDTHPHSDADFVSGAKARLPGAFERPLLDRMMPAAIVAALAVPFTYSAVAFGATPARFIEGLTRLGNILSFMFPPHIWTTWQEWSEILEGLGETVVMAFLGTLLGALAALPLALLGAKNIMPFSWLRLLSRRGFDALRAVEQIILALIFIRAFGLGPMAGILAIAVSEIGTFAKLFAEAIENTSRKPVDGVKASGGSNMQAIRYAIMPQALPVILSIILYNFESNARSGTILGIVGAGGIGFLLADRMHAFRWPEAWSIIFLIIATVYCIDAASAWLRKRLI
ncbi:phosphonate ABC transporter, permease protein PhnE [Neorhizobium sp. CSC1952]|uniref:phosphonate ABC transporter, permease protein PhnE n=1 Tax=Neorhizobium sp. CSC1952 TaxID=2978974 RepID=UPI0025A4CF27|nr:phosphonate ABC transporter, permease protein PhnE [Rhizobium sp. CSC1952]WJR68760.1 phosphonate ABC transporter, permease protein PhnE [Rhizobium sp. CSC1952]